MIAGIEERADIEVYVEAEELVRLNSGNIGGVLIRTYLPKQQGILHLSINDQRQYDDGCGIGIDHTQYWNRQRDFVLSVFMGKNWYKQLCERGVVELRHRMIDGAKIAIYDRSRLSGVGRLGAEELDIYWNMNKPGSF